MGIPTQQIGQWGLQQAMAQYGLQQQNKARGLQQQVELLGSLMAQPAFGPSNMPHIMEPPSPIDWLRQRVREVCWKPGET